ncbi:MAG TPA: hypothetical protein VEW71_04850 [Allosphingosinicella sp.]|nr:hypothetical protein [Allosphingosinicella sp.]
MADEKRMVCLAVAVADAIRGKYLSGALNEARRFHEWARTLGYESTLITDADEPVTIETLRKALEKALWPKKKGAAGDDLPAPVTDRLILYFAGHGLIRGADEGLWLLSDWEDELRAVGVDALRRKLFRYPIKQLAIIADACRELPGDMDQADLEADGVLGRGPAPRLEPWFDRFVATQDGTTTFMVPGNDPEDDRCVFSGVLLEGLWGLNKAAFSPLDPSAVTGNSLSVFLKAEVQRVSALYANPRVPSVSASFPAGEDVYFKVDPKFVPPPLPAWPAPGKLMGMGTGRPREKTVSINIDQPWEQEEQTKKTQVFYRRGGTQTPTRPAGRRKPKPPFQGMVEQLSTSRAGGFPGPAGLAAFGAPVLAIWHARDAYFTRLASDPWWAVQLAVSQSDHRALPARVLIEFADGPVVATIVLPHMVTKVARDAHGASAIVIPESHGPPTVKVAQQALLAMEQGALHAEKAVDLAVALRQLKHVDPVLGVISAYLYDTMGDLESIRRMAYFYVRHGQPIPYDIALLGLLHGWHQGDQLWVAVPDVPERAPRSALEQAHDWTYRETQAVSGAVGGDWPWMRQGWAFLEDPTEEESTLIVPELLKVLPHLTPGRFATVDRAGAQILAERFGLKRREQ